MRLNILLFAVVLSFPSLGWSAEKKKPAKKPSKKVTREYADFPRLLTARELLAMGPVKRQEYFENLRAMLNDLDRLSFLKLGRLVASTDHPSTDFVARHPAFFELFAYLVPEAHAAECLDPRYPFAVGSLCGSLCAGRGAGRGETGRAVENVYFCFPEKDYQRWSQANGGRGQLDLPEDLRYLNPGSWSEREPKIIAAQRKRAEEIISANIEAEERDTGAAMREMRRQAFEKEVAENQDREEAETGAAMKRMLQEAREREISENIDREEMQTGESIKRMQQEAREREISENIDREEAQTGENMRQMQAEAEKQKRIAEREKLISDNIDREQADMGESLRKQEAARKLAEERKLAEQSKLTAGKTPEKGLADGKCSPAKLSCTDRDEYLKKSHKGALKTFRASKPVNCVSAGNMSQYAGNEVKAGNCGVVRDFCLRKDDCAKPAADSEGGFKTRYSCPAGQAICSPFIYGLETKQKAICVAQKGKHLTEACDDKAKALKGKDGYVGDFLGQAPAGVAEAWDEYATAFNGTCKQKTESQDAHCLECGIIGRRLQDARALASGSCTDALGYKQMKPGTGAPPATAQ